MPNLFNRTGLEQTTGEIPERWKQDGSTLQTSAAQFIATAGTLLTVTAGKTFYMTNITYYCNVASSLNTIDDDTTVKLYLTAGVAFSQFSETFRTPIAFTTSVKSSATTNAWNITITGWEE